MTEYTDADAGSPHHGSEIARTADPWAAGGSALPHPATPFPSSTRWTESVERGRVELPDGRSPWGAPDPPASVPAPMAGIEGPHTRAGWLTRTRDRGEGADG